jgi:hypothetical protein
MFYRASDQPGDVGIMLTDSPGSHILNNTVLTSGTYANPIEYRYTSTQGGVIANNLVDGLIAARNGATATLLRNLERAARSLLIDANGGDLHLAATATAAIDQGEAIPSVDGDFDGQPRPVGVAYDIGADERSAASVTYAISGRLTDAATGAAVSGVAVTLSGGASQTAYTDSSGVFSFSGLPAGLRFIVSPSQSGFSFSPGSTEFPTLARNEQADFSRSAPLVLNGGAGFLGTDSTTQGGWRGKYGAQGYVLADDIANPPAGVEISVARASAWTWAGLTTDTRALERGGSASRFAATWYAGTSFTIDINATDDQTHRVALYLLDWDQQNRAEKIDVLDAATGTLLDTRAVVGFSGGRYLVWTVRGHVSFLVTRTGGSNSVVSAVFIDPTSSAPVVSLTSPASGASFSAGATISLAATASDADGSVTKVDFFANGTLVGTDTTAPFSGSWLNVPAGNYNITAVAMDNSGLTTTSAALPITVTPSSTSGTSASFVRADATTQGNWRGVYGADGYSIAGDTTVVPSYAQLQRSGASSWTWTTTTTDVRALQKPTSGRIAAAWYAANAFSVDLNLTDAQLHQVALYFLDWDGGGRTQRVDLRDATTGVLLDSRSVGSFVSGQYLVWTVRGRVRFEITRVAGPNALLNGLFVGPGTAATVPTNGAAFVGTDAQTQGNWRGVYGADGYTVNGDTTMAAPYGTTTVSGASSWTWQASSTEVRSLQRATSGRVAAAWFAPTTFSIAVNVSDGQPHRLALYMLDWDRQNRKQRIDIVDATTGAVLDTRTVTAFDNGIYLVWDVSRPVTVKVTGEGGPNAVVSGVFLGPRP